MSEFIPHRYLIKICDQVVFLISSKHVQTIVWSGVDANDDQMLVINKGGSDRMFTFGVAQTKKQGESVTVREGFKVSISYTPALSWLTKFVRCITILDCVEGDCTSRGHGRSGSNEPYAKCTILTLWRDDKRIHDGETPRGWGDMRQV